MTQMLQRAFQGSLSTTLAVTAANTVVTVPPGYGSLMVSMLGVTGDDIICNPSATVAAPTPGTFSAGQIVQRGTVQVFYLSGMGGTFSFTPFAAGGTIGLTLGNGI